MKYLKNLKTNFFFILSAAALIMLTFLQGEDFSYYGAIAGIRFYTIVTLLIVVFAISLLKKNLLADKYPFTKRERIYMIAITCLFCFLTSVHFRNVLLYALPVRQAGAVHTMVVLFTVLWPAAGFAAVFPALRSLVGFSCQLVRKIEKSAGPSRKKLPKKNVSLMWLYSGVTSFIVITFCSKSSFLYPFNDWVDANCFFTVGKSILHGKILYLDIFEQKGPILYFMHSLAYLISQHSFMGVYVIEIAACSVFLFFAYRTIALFCRKQHFWIIPLMGVVLYASPAFSHGDSAEELCLPILMYCFYLSIKSIYIGRHYSKRELFGVGISAACVLWIKFTLLGFFFGWVAVPFVLLLLQRQWMPLLKSFFLLLAGFAVTTAAVLLYFAVNHALRALYEVYFYDNLFVYSNVSGSTEGENLFTRLFNNVLHGFQMSSYNNIFIFIFLAAGLIWILSRREKTLVAHILITFLFTLMFVYIGGHAYRYYFLILGIFIVFGMAFLCNVAEAGLFHLPNRRKPGHIQLRKYACALVFSLAFVFLSSPNVYLMQYNQGQLPQYKFRAIICAVKNPTLLNYGFLDGGFYTVCGIVPNCKYFCTCNIKLKAMHKVQSSYIKEGKEDFVIMRDNKLHSLRYRCVSKAVGYYEDKKFVYYLYEKNRLLTDLEKQKQKPAQLNKA